MAINLTEKQLAAADFVESFREKLEASTLNPSDFEFEITEAVLLARNVDAIRANLEALNKMGVTIALDDFGTGFASLTHLRAFPIDVIKIDKSFVTDMASNRESAIICKALVHMAHDLQMSVVAEGVECAIVAEDLRAIGCDIAQGYHFAKPCAFEDVVAALREAQSRGAA